MKRYLPVLLVLLLVLALGAMPLLAQSDTEVSSVFSSEKADFTFEYPSAWTLVEDPSFDLVFLSPSPTMTRSATGAIENADPVLMTFAGHRFLTTILGSFDPQDKDGVLSALGDLLGFEFAPGTQMQVGPRELFEAVILYPASLGLRGVVYAFDMPNDELGLMIIDVLPASWDEYKPQFMAIVDSFNGFGLTATAEAPGVSVRHPEGWAVAADANLDLLFISESPDMVRLPSGGIDNSLPILITFVGPDLLSLLVPTASPDDKEAVLTELGPVIGFSFGPAEQVVIGGHDAIVADVVYASGSILQGVAFVIEFEPDRLTLATVDVLGEVFEDYVDLYTAIIGTFRLVEPETPQ